MYINATTIVLMATIIKISGLLKLCSKPSTAFLDNFISVIKSGISNGKLNTAIKLKLLPAFDAMALTMLNIKPKPKLPSNAAIKKYNMSCTKLPIKVE